MNLVEELGEQVRNWKSLGVDKIRSWELKAIDQQADMDALKKRNLKLENAVQEGDQRFSDLQDEHKDALDRNRKLEAAT